MAEIGVTHGQKNFYVVSIFQGTPEVGKKENNLKKMKSMIKNASVMNSDLIVFPELFLTGYSITREQLTDLAETSAGPSNDEVAKYAKEYKIAVIYGYPEKVEHDGKITYFNSAKLIDKNGESRGDYRKIHPWGNEDKLFCAGDKLAIVDLDGLKVGIIICYDIHFAELFVAMVTKGVNIIICASAIPTGYPATTQLVPGCRALESKVYVVLANQCGIDINGEHFIGESCICKPNGIDLIRAGNEECLLTATIDTEQCHSLGSDPILRDRRPDLYKKLLYDV